MDWKRGAGVVSAAAIAGLAGAAHGQVIPSGETYNIAFFGSNSQDSFIFANAFGDTELAFDGLTETVTGQPSDFAGTPVGPEVSYDVSESVTNNGDGTVTVNVTVEAQEDAFLQPGLDFDSFVEGDQTIDTFEVDLGTVITGVNNGINTTSDDIEFLGATATWLADGNVEGEFDVAEHIEVSLGGQIDNLATGPGLKGQFGFTTDDGGDLFAQVPLDTFSLDMTLTPAPGSLALLGLGGMAGFRRRRG